MFGFRPKRVLLILPWFIFSVRPWTSVVGVLKTSFFRYYSMLKLTNLGDPPGWLLVSLPCYDSTIAVYCRHVILRQLQIRVLNLFTKYFNV